VKVGGPDEVPSFSHNALGGGREAALFLICALVSGSGGRNEKLAEERRMENGEGLLLWYGGEEKKGECPLSLSVAWMMGHQKEGGKRKSGDDHFPATAGGWGKPQPFPLAE